MFIFASRDNMQPSTPSSGGPTAAPRRTSNRYTRSSTTSVTQLLSDSCSSLLQRLTNRVRGPSSANDRGLFTSTTSSNIAPPVVATTSTSTPGTPRHHHHHRRNATTRHRDDSSLLGSARSRIEEKYSAILERKPSFLSSSRLNLRQREREREREPSPFIREERTLEPSARRSILKSPSTILLSEKAYPYVSPVRREKTPCGHERRAHRPRRNAEGRASG